MKILDLLYKNKVSIHDIIEYLKEYNDKEELLYILDNKKYVWSI